MHAMQYSVALPADYDMSIIRKRVRTKGSAFDRWPDLAFKAFLISERDAGATANRYAPFYLWLGDAGRSDFLLGDGFHTFATDFGRPRVDHWMPIGVVRGREPLAARGPVARAATRTVLPLTEPDLRPVRAREEERLASLAADAPGLVAAVSAVDPSRWSLVRFELWAREQPDQTPAPDETRYEVLHLAAPDLAGAAAG